MNLEALQTALRDANLDGWLFYDHHHRDPIAYRVLGLDENSFVSRRWFYFVPLTGEPKKLVHRIESSKLDTLPGSKDAYSSWQELESKLEAMLGGSTTIAMQYSPRNAIMYVAMVDAGTVELVRGFGKTVVSSADLVSLFEAVLTEEQIDSHYAAQQKVDAILAAGWRRIGDSVRAGTAIGEIDVVNFFLDSFQREGLFTDHGPNCSVGNNSADSHYEPTKETSRLIKAGDFVLIDIWAKISSPEAIWYDITWTGVVGREPSEREHLIFNTVRDARDAAITTVQEAYAAGKAIAGWQADDAARNVIRNAGFADAFTHRTGHNIEVSLHGNGAHLDNLETHDERLLLPNTCFSVEPGLYFPGAAGDPNAFGVRSEVDMITRPGKAVVTGPAQSALLRI
ncbi:M24 family metallopeptidase [Granulicella paludicola]|uniref:M24 family metallopeptidase n=1 Tax=Granulicella paludicola TaxID=474951 RepID=UPI0021DFAA71|nr:M24 family metallopeptidase [Granulicella paludicola]